MSFYLEKTNGETVYITEEYLKNKLIECANNEQALASEIWDLSDSNAQQLDNIAKRVGITVETITSQELSNIIIERISEVNIDAMSSLASMNRIHLVTLGYLLNKNVMQTSDLIEFIEADSVYTRTSMLLGFITTNKAKIDVFAGIRYSLRSLIDVNNDGELSTPDEKDTSITYGDKIRDAITNINIVCGYEDSVLSAFMINEKNKSTSISELKNQMIDKIIDFNVEEKELEWWEYALIFIFSSPVLVWPVICMYKDWKNRISESEYEELKEEFKPHYEKILYNAVRQAIQYAIMSSIPVIYARDEFESKNRVMEEQKSYIYDLMSEACVYAITAEYREAIETIIKYQDDTLNAQKMYLKYNEFSRVSSCHLAMIDALCRETIRDLITSTEDENYFERYSDILKDDFCETYVDYFSLKNPMTKILDEYASTMSLDGGASEENKTTRKKLINMCSGSINIESLRSLMKTYFRIKDSIGDGNTIYPSIINDYLREITIDSMISPWKVQYKVESDTNKIITKIGGPGQTEMVYDRIDNSFNMYLNDIIDGELFAKVKNFGTMKIMSCIDNMLNYAITDEISNEMIEDTYNDLESAKTHLKKIKKSIAQAFQTITFNAQDKPAAAVAYELLQNYCDFILYGNAIFHRSTYEINEDELRDLEGYSDKLFIPYLSKAYYAYYKMAFIGRHSYIGAANVSNAINDKLYHYRTLVSTGTEESLAMIIAIIMEEIL